MAKVILTGYIIVPSTDLQSVLAVLPEHIALTKKEPGCLVFEVEQDHEIVNRFSVYEAFINRDAFDAHQARVGNSRWGKVTARVERHYKITEL